MQGFAKHLRERRRCHGREGGAKGSGMDALPPHVGQGAPPTAHVPPRGRWPHPVDPRDPSGGPGTIPVTPKLVR